MTTYMMASTLNNALAVVSGMSLIAILAAAAMGILVLVAKWKIFTKAGQAGWKSLIPVYGSYVEYTFTWSRLHGILVPVAMLVARIITSVADSGSVIYGLATIPAIYAGVAAVIQLHKLSKSFGHGIGFTLGLIFLNPIFLMILGFEKNSEYVGPIVKAK